MDSSSEINTCSGRSFQQLTQFFIIALYNYIILNIIPYYHKHSLTTTGNVILTTTTTSYTQVLHNQTMTSLEKSRPGAPPGVAERLGGEDVQLLAIEERWKLTKFSDDFSMILMLFERFLMFFIECFFIFADKF